MATDFKLTFSSETMYWFLIRPLRNNYSNYLILSQYNTYEKRRHIWLSILLLFGKQDWWLQALKELNVRTLFKSDPSESRIRIVISANSYNKEETQYQRKYPDDENWDFSNFLRIGYHNHQSCGSISGCFRMYWSDLFFLFKFLFLFLVGWTRSNNTWGKRLWVVFVSSRIRIRVS